MDVNDFIQKYCFWCPRMSANITLEQCKRNKKRSKKTAFVDENARISLKHCENCTEQDRKRYQAGLLESEPKPNPETEKTTRFCIYCKQELSKKNFRKNKVTGDLVTMCDMCEYKFGKGPYKNEWKKRRNHPRAKYN